MGLFSGVKSIVSGLLGSSGTGSSGTGWTSAGLSLLDSGLTSLSNSLAARQSWKYDKKLMDYQNEYNLPVNMRARLEEAGYNPNLALNGVNVQSASSSAPTVQPSKVDLLQAYNLEEQNELLRAQKNLTIDNALLAQERFEEVRKRNVISQYNLDYADAEHELWLKTGKIPQSYYKSDWQSELTSLIKGLLLN